MEEQTSSASGPPARKPSTVEEIFIDYRARHAGLLRALTIDFDTFYAQCDPEKDNLCLYGYPNESWELALPPDEAPSKIPDPTIGINFARDNTVQRGWLYLVGCHSDSWLISVAFFYASLSSLNAADRDRLFTLINSLPTVDEAVTDWLTVQGKPKNDKSSEASGSKSTIPLKRSSDGQIKSTSDTVEESHAENEEKHKVTRCGSCVKVYTVDGFWIACDFCMLWYHGKCVNVTPAIAEKIDKQMPFLHQETNQTVVCRN